MTSEEFDKYWLEMNTYRNEYSIHAEHELTKQRGGTHPYLWKAFDTFKALHAILLSIINNLPSQAQQASDTQFKVPNLTTDELLHLFNEDLQKTILEIYKQN